MKKILLVLISLLIGANISFAQANLNTFFKDANTFFVKNVMYNKVRYSSIKSQPNSLNKLLNFIAVTDVSANTANEQKAYYINAYNLLVIKGVVNNYPIANPTNVTGFFDAVKYTVGGKKYTLNGLEKKKLLTPYKDGRLHFVLVCAAISCPPIADFAYTPKALDEQLNSRTKAALDNVVFIIYDEETQKAKISEIFKWYTNDFKPNVKAFINQYRTTKLPEEVKLNYYAYNWTLNDASASNGTSEGTASTDFQPIIVAATMPKGKMELNTFHSIYTAWYPKYNNAKYSGYTGLFMFGYGLTGKLDVGLDFILKSSRFGESKEANPFKTLDFQQGVDTVSSPGKTITRDFGLSHIGPKIRFAPFKKLPITFEQAIYFPVANLPKNNKVDQNFYWVTQIYYNHEFSDKFGGFVALTFWQPIAPKQQFKLDAPYLKLFFSWYATKRFTMYATTTSFTEWGGGAKFLITPQLEIQALYTYYVPIPGLSDIYTKGGKDVMTFNLGLRVRI